MDVAEHAAQRTPGRPPRARRRTRHAGSRARRTRALLGGLAIVAASALLAIAGGGPVVARPAPVDPAGAGGAVTQDAPALYLQNCASCHGAAGEGSEIAPSLRGVGAASVDFNLRTGRMPLGAPGQQAARGAPAFDEAGIEALVAYVAAFGPGGPAIPAVRGGGDVGRGWALYQANCAACHAATGSGNAVGGGFAAVGLGQSTPREIGEATVVGPGVMPIFGFDDGQRADIVAYIEYLRSARAPGGVPIAVNGPVSEGFVAVVVAVPLLVVVALFVGRRSNRDDPA